MKQKDKPLTIRTDTPFPRPICLESCDLDYKKGYEKFIFETLKAFSTPEAFQAKNPHPLHKSPEIERESKLAKKYGSNKVMSLDVKSRNDTKRLFYCETEEHVFKLSLIHI